MNQSVLANNREVRSSKDTFQYPDVLSVTSEQIENSGGIIDLDTQQFIFPSGVSISKNDLIYFDKDTDDEKKYKVIDTNTAKNRVIAFAKIVKA